MMSDHDDRIIETDSIHEHPAPSGEGEPESQVDRPERKREPGPPARASVEDDDELIGELGPLFVHYLFSAIKTIQVHDLNNRATKRVMSDLTEQLRKLAEVEGVVNLRVSSDYLYINDVRLNIDSQNFGPFMYLLEEVKERDVEAVEFYPEVTVEEVGQFLMLFFGEVPDDDAFGHVEKRISDAAITHIKISQCVEREKLFEDSSERQRNIRKESTKVFFRTVLLMGEVLRGIEQKKVIKIPKAERLTQQMVDIIQTDESILLGLTSMKDFDEYTFAHSVNVCVLSMVIADRLHMYKGDIARLGVAALLHDIGKTYVPQSILNKASKLVGSDWDLMKYHTFFGVKEVSRIKSLREVADALFVTLQHHVHFNGNGYPSRPGGWNLHLFTRIVTIADYFDAMTTPRVYCMNPLTPDRALQFILQKSGEIFDPFLAKVFIQAMGLYPIGTLVELDTGEKGIVVRQNESNRFIHRPMVTPLMKDGTFSPEVEPFDLTEPSLSGPGYRRSIVRSLYDSVTEKKKVDFFASE